MKITSFQPIILENDSPAADGKELFESLGFKVSHIKNTDDQVFTTTDLKNEDGFKLSVTKIGALSKTMMGIRMNVDNLNEAVDFFEKNGFVNKSDDNTHGNTTSVNAMMVNADGLVIVVAEHLK